MAGRLRAVSTPVAPGGGDRCLLAVLSGVFTYAVLAGLTSFNPTSTVFIILILINLTLGLSLGALIAWRLVRLWSERRSGRAGARLHVRLVAMFSTIAVVPTIFVAIFAAVTLNLGVEAWFSATSKQRSRAPTTSRGFIFWSTQRDHSIDAARSRSGYSIDRKISDLTTGRQSILA